MKEKTNNKLDIWVLNAGEGDSIILHNQHDGKQYFALIDSNHVNSVAPALNKLRQLGCDKLNFVLLTHPHADHYKGFPEVLEEFPTDLFYSYPIKIDQAGRLKKLAQIYAEKAKHPTKTIRTTAVQFLRTLEKAKKSGNWQELTGPENRIRPNGFSNLELTALLPLPKNKGEYFQMIETGSSEAFEGQNLNNLSVALRLRYSGFELILGADGTSTSWRDHQKELKKTNDTLSAGAVKLPHHGSKTDSNKNAIDYFYQDSQKEDAIALISAIGNKHHPHDEVIECLITKGIKPYCTNLSNKCSGNIKHLTTDPNLSKSLNRFVSQNIVDSENQPCQGDICLSIYDNGTHTVSTEHNFPCPYRGDFEHFFD